MFVISSCHRLGLSSACCELWWAPNGWWHCVLSGTSMVPNVWHCVPSGFDALLQEFEDKLKLKGLKDTTATTASAPGTRSSDSEGAGAKFSSTTEGSEAPRAPGALAHSSSLPKDLHGRPVATGAAAANGGSRSAGKRTTSVKGPTYVDLVHGMKNVHDAYERHIKKHEVGSGAGAGGALGALLPACLPAWQPGTGGGGDLADYSV